MTDIKIDPATGDLDVSSFGGPRLFTSREKLQAIAQRVRIRLRRFRGEWFLDQGVGVPWMQQILGVKNATALAEVLIRDEVAKTPGIVSVEQVTVELDTDRMATITVKATAEDGSIVVEGEPLLYPTALPWTPAAIMSSLAFWYDVGDLSTVTAVSGYIGTVTDKGPNGYDLHDMSSSFYNFDPTANGPQLDDFIAAFGGDVVDGSERGLGYYDVDATINVHDVAFSLGWIGAATFDTDGGSPQGNALFGGALDSGGLTDGAVLVGEATTANLLDVGGSAVELRINGNAAVGMDTNPAVLTTTALLIVSRAAAIPLNDGFVFGTSRIGSAGGTFTWDGFIGEVVGTSTALSLSDKQKLEGYLAHKWGRTALLPGGHPYKTTPPTL